MHEKGSFRSGTYNIIDYYYVLPTASKMRMTPIRPTTRSSTFYFDGFPHSGGTAAIVVVVVVVEYVKDRPPHSQMAKDDDDRIALIVVVVGDGDDCLPYHHHLLYGWIGMASNECLQSWTVKTKEFLLWMHGGCCCGR